jgi:hypothetical protein
MTTQNEIRKKLSISLIIFTTVNDKNLKEMTDEHKWTECSQTI